MIIASAASRKRNKTGQGLVQLAGGDLTAITPNVLRRPPPPQPTTEEDEERNWAARFVPPPTMGASTSADPVTFGFGGGFGAATFLDEV